MSDFVVIKNLKAPLADIQITDGVVEENVDYALMVDVALYEEKIKKGTGEETPDRTFVFQPTGSIVLINKNKLNERNAGNPNPPEYVTGAGIV
jgi:hypothetical protein